MTKKRSNQLALPGVGRRGKPKTAAVRYRRSKSNVTTEPSTDGNVKLPTNYVAARKALAMCVKVDEVRNIKDQAVAMEVYAFQRKDKELAAWSVEIKKRALRRIGELMEDQRKAGKMAKGTRGAGRPKKGGGANPPPKEQTLASQGVDKDLAKEARKAASVSAAEHERDVAKAIRRTVAAIEGDKAIIAEVRADAQKAKKANRQKKEQELATKIIALPQKRYGVILADPEWQFEPYSRETGMDRAADNHYQTSPLEEIKKRDVASIAADGCVLFLWATAPMMPQALEVMAAWGFEYKSQVVWVKGRVGTGYWFRGRHEILLVGTRGNVPAPAPGSQFESVFIAPIGAHSEKPDKAYEIIEAYFPNLPKLEMNARKARIGWSSWGLEAPSQAEAAE